MRKLLGIRCCKLLHCSILLIDITMNEHQNHRLARWRPRTSARRGNWLVWAFRTCLTVTSPWAGATSGVSADSPCTECTTPRGPGASTRRRSIPTRVESRGKKVTAGTTYDPWSKRFDFCISRIIWIKGTWKIQDQISPFFSNESETLSIEVKE